MSLFDTKPTNDPSKVGQGRKPVLPLPGTKWSQAEAHYEPQVAPGGCSACMHFDPTRHQCEVVAGFIQSDGCCDFFNDQSAPPPPVTKFQSGYVRVKGAIYQCSDCAFFSKNSCQIVSGPINPGGVCWEWNNTNGEGGQNEADANVTDALPSSPDLDTPVPTQPGRPS